MILTDLQKFITGQSRKCLFRDSSLDSIHISSLIYKMDNYILKSGDSHYAKFLNLNFEKK